MRNILENPAGNRKTWKIREEYIPIKRGGLANVRGSKNIERKRENEKKKSKE